MISSEWRERAKICVLLRRKNVLHTDQKLEKAIINDCEQANCVCVSETCDSSHTGGGPGGPRLRAPGGVQGARGQSPRKLSSFQQIRAFKDGRQE